MFLVQLRSNEKGNCTHSTVEWAMYKVGYGAPRGGLAKICLLIYTVVPQGLATASTNLCVCVFICVYIYTPNTILSMYCCVHVVLHNYVLYKLYNYG